MIHWLLQPRLPYERLRYLLLALLFAIPSLALAGVGFALLQDLDTFALSISFDAMHAIYPDESAWGCAMLAAAGFHIFLMLVAVRVAWLALLPHVFIFMIIGVSMALGYGVASTGFWMYAIAGALDSVLTATCWSFLTNR